MSVQTSSWDSQNALWFPARWALRPLQLAILFPSLLYVATLVVFLFRPPDLNLFYADRIAFCTLTFLVVLRMLAIRQTIPFIPRITLPMLGLAALAMVRAFRDEFDVQNWSLVASKFVVPFVLFHLAILVFQNSQARNHFELFVIAALAYLIFTAIAFLVDAPALIFPRFILDSSMGIHMDRARGPFLQAVPNGLSLNLLGLLALAFAQRRRKLVLLLWLALPVAILATMTRAVWIGFVVSTVAVGFRLGDRPLRRACLGLVLVGTLGGALAISGSSSLRDALTDRTEERGPVAVRVAVYDAGWSMIRERPLTGWPAAGMYRELARRMEGYRLRAFYIHNTYLSLLIEFGIPGLILYAAIFIPLLRIGRLQHRETAPSALRKIWPILLGVYLFNACFVDMVYQFVIGLLFTVAGMLVAEGETAS
jgi:O-antigen ligase